MNTWLGKGMKVAQNATALQCRPLTGTRKGEQDKQKSQAVFNTTLLLPLSWSRKVHSMVPEHQVGWEKKTPTEVSSHQQKTQHATTEKCIPHCLFWEAFAGVQKKCVIFRAAEVHFHETNGSSTVEGIGHHQLNKQRSGQKVSTSNSCNIMFLFPNLENFEKVSNKNLLYVRITFFKKTDTFLTAVSVWIGRTESEWWVKNRFSYPTYIFLDLFQNKQNSVLGFNMHSHLKVVCHWATFIKRITWNDSVNKAMDSLL